MTKYEIAGNVVEITTAVENYRQYTLIMNPYLKDVKSKFSSWYSKQYSANDIYENAADFCCDILYPILDEAVTIFNDHDIFTIDREMLFDKCCVDVYRKIFREALIDMMEKIDEIDYSKQEAQQYRRIRKESRGRVVGGGFGVKGALKGMATAGAFNAATGTAHSIRNAVGNMGDAIVASANKQAVLNNSKSILADAIYETIDKICDNIRDLLAEKTNMKFKYVTVSESNQAKAILKNYLGGKIPDDKRCSNIIQALQLNPYLLDIYKVIWNDYGDDSGDLIKMANYFNVPLEKYVYDIAIKECESIFATYCDEYINSNNPIIAAISIEEKIKTAYDEMKNYVKNHNLVEEKIEKIGICKNILEQINQELRIVNGVIYNSREEAEQILYDRSLFYQYLEDKDVEEVETQEGLKTLSYLSSTYKNQIENMIQQECILRNPTKIFENLNTLVMKYFPNDKSKFDVQNFGMLQSKEPIIRKITEMPSDEGLLFLFDETSNGKKGVLLTNINLRVYQKGKILGENNAIRLEEINDLKCLGKNEYLVVCGEDNFKFSIRSGYDITFQNQLCRCLKECIFILKNLKANHRKMLPFISSESLQCECGTYLPVGVKMCPNCYKKYTLDGKFVDTFPCPSCGNRIVEGKKFCDSCGTKIEDDGEAVMVQTNQKKIKYCSQCGSQVQLGKKFCSQCGASLKKGE